MTGDATGPAHGAVDLGATNLRAAVGRADGEFAAVERRPTPRGPDGDAVADGVLGALRAACDAASVAPGRLRAVGVGTVGPLAADAGAVIDPPNLPVGRIPLRERLAGALPDGTPVVVRNDAVAAVAGERRYAGAPPDVVYLTLSTGVGAGACVDGHRLSGVGGNAAELGHVVVDSDGRLPCGCGARGHWEAYCSGEAIPRYARYLYGRARRGELPDETGPATPGGDRKRDRPPGHRPPTDGRVPGADPDPAVAGRGDSGADAGHDDGDPLPAVEGDPAATDLSLEPPASDDPRPPMAALADPGLSAAEVFGAADGDPLAALTVRRVARHTAVGLAAAVHAYAPGLVSVGGAVALNNPDRVLAPARRRLPPLLATPAPDLRVTPLGGDAVLAGALALAVEAGGDG